jgi:hypothetical protein
LAQAAATGCANHDAALDVMASAYDCFAKERSCGGEWEHMYSGEWKQGKKVEKECAREKESV